MVLWGCTEDVDDAPGQGRVVETKHVCMHGFDVQYQCNQCESLSRGNTSIPPNTKYVVKTDTEDFDLTQIPYSSLVRVAKVFREGELKYGKGNWRHGKNDRDYQLERANHALKHLLIYIHDLQHNEYLGTTFNTKKEDDLAKVIWFCCTQIELERVQDGKT